MVVERNSRAHLGGLVFEDDRALHFAGWLQDLVVEMI